MHIKGITVLDHELRITETEPMEKYSDGYVTGDKVLCFPKRCKGIWVFHHSYGLTQDLDSVPMDLECVFYYVGSKLECDLFDSGLKLGAFLERCRANEIIGLT